MNGKTIIKKALCLTLAALMLLPLLLSVSAADGEIDLAQKGIRIGVESGTDQERLITEMYPDADISYYEHLNGYIAVQQGKIDAYVYGKNKMELAVEAGLTGVKVLDETVGEPIQIALGLSDNSDIPDLRARVTALSLKSRLTAPSTICTTAG